MSGQSFIQQLEKIQSANSAINAIAGLLIKFQVDSECANEIPEEIKNGNVRVGLLEAVLIAADASMCAVEQMELEIKKQGQGVKIHE